MSSKVRLWSRPWSECPEVVTERGLMEFVAVKEEVFEVSIALLCCRLC
jgi:hypothetical protein